MSTKSVLIKLKVLELGNIMMASHFLLSKRSHSKIIYWYNSDEGANQLKLHYCQESTKTEFLISRNVQDFLVWILYLLCFDFIFQLN